MTKSVFHDCTYLSAIALISPNQVPQGKAPLASPLPSPAEESQQEDGSAVSKSQDLETLPVTCSMCWYGVWYASNADVESKMICAYDGMHGGCLDS